MRLVLALVAVSISVLPAGAISRINATALNCGQIQSIIAREGAVILRYKSPRSGATLYNRYVSHPRFCESAKRALFETVPSRDRRACPVRVCREQIDDTFN